MLIHAFAFISRYTLYGWIAFHYIIEYPTICLSSWRTFELFPVKAFINNVTMNIYVGIFLWTYDFHFSGVNTRKGSIVVNAFIIRWIFNFARKRYFPKWFYCFIFQPAICKSLCYSISSLMTAILIIAYQVGINRKLILFFFPFSWKLMT